MNSERWQRLQLLFEEVRSQPAMARRAFIESACGGEVELRDELISLLEVYEQKSAIEDLPTVWLGALVAPASSRFARGDRVAGRYLIQRLLGRGGMGEVYEAWDEELSITVALKTLHLAGSTDEALKSLKLEGLLARSVWHPNVCRVYDLGRHGEGKGTEWFLTMELLRGETLSNRLRNPKRLSLDQVLRFAEQMAAGLGAAHRAGVVHRDFKTSNVMLVAKDGGGEQAVVTDFGTARAAPRTALEKDGERASGMIIGTPAYMAPEQVRGEGVGPPADIYALGIVLYEMVTGVLPFTGGSALELARRRLEADPPSPRSVRPELDKRWEAVILRCLARDPTGRFGRAEEVAEAIAGRSPIADEARDLPNRAQHTLPAERDLFVGREIETKELDRILASGSRLVTLLGAGGMGKTRLTVHYGWRSLEEYPGGVWFCDLTEARTLNGIASAVAGSLGVQLGRGDPLVQLAHAIAGRNACLMILDNFEQVVDHAGETLGRWLEQAPQARFLVTSRERLNLSGEWVHAVKPLSIEMGMELFVTRAQGLSPGLELAGPEAESALEIVRLVDGMPLAIELAAARMRVMSAGQIVAQMRKRFQLLTGGPSARHETLEMTIDGSWDLLRPWERAAWAQCSVFEGGFSLEAAEAVVDLNAWPEKPWIVDVIQSLVDKSLLRTWVTKGGSGAGTTEMRFGMYASLQEYARLKLRQDDDIAYGWRGAEAERVAEERHGKWFARYGTTKGLQALDSHDGFRQRRRLELDLDNLIAACRRAVRRRDPGTAVAAYRGSWAVLELRGPFGPAVELGREILQESQLGREEEAYVAKTLGSSEWFSGLIDDARIHLEAALAMAREFGDRWLEAAVMINLGGMHFSQGRLEEARLCLDQALVAALEVGDRHAESNILNTLSMIDRDLSRIEDAAAHAEKALAIARLEGDRSHEGTVRSNLGLLQHDRGRTEEARAHYEAAIAIHREVGNRRFEGNVYANLGNLNYHQGELEEARTHMEAALAIHREVGNRHMEAIALNNLGSVHAAQGRPEEARTHFEAALAIAGELGNKRLEGNIVGALGGLHHDQGEIEAAHSYYDAALAIHREVGDRRYEGIVLTQLARLLHDQGSVEAALEALHEAEPLLRQVEDLLEIGTLLCVRAKIEQSSGNTAEAMTTLLEAEALAKRTGAGPDSDLARMIAELRETLSGLPLGRATPEPATKPR